MKLQVLTFDPPKFRGINSKQNAITTVEKWAEFERLKLLLEEQVKTQSVMNGQKKIGKSKEFIITTKEQ